MYKRSTILINKRFQLKFAFFMCSWIFALSMIYPIIIYSIFEFFMKASNAGALTQVFSADKVKEIENQVLMLLGILQLLFLSTTFIISLFVSHRIAGPLYKLRQAMNEVTKGNLDIRITFRKNDHFIEMQDTFNEMIQSLSIRKQK